jgi:hypothetical protein
VDDELKMPAAMGDEVAAEPTSGGLVSRLHPGGLTIGVVFPRPVTSAVVAPEGISAAYAADTLGEGYATVRVRDGAALRDGEAVKVYSHFTVAVPGHTRVVVAWDGGAYILVGADCQP